MMLDLRLQDFRGTQPLLVDRFTRTADFDYVPACAGAVTATATARKKRLLLKIDGVKLITGSLCNCLAITIGEFGKKGAGYI
jgi:hypothetical protein